MRIAEELMRKDLTAWHAKLAGKRNNKIVCVFARRHKLFFGTNLFQGFFQDTAVANFMKALLNNFRIFNIGIGK